MEEGSSSGGSRVAQDVAGAPALPLDKLLDAAWELALHLSAPVRLAGLSLLATYAPAALEGLADDATRVLAGEAPRGLLAELARSAARR